MSTRSITHFIGYGQTDKPVARIYRHSDGYPEGAGVDLKVFLNTIKAEVADTRFSDPGYLAAKYVVFLADLFSRTYKNGKWEKADSKFDFISVGVMDSDPGDIEFIYQVNCDLIDENGFPTVTCLEEGSLRVVTIPEVEGDKLTSIYEESVTT